MRAKSGMVLTAVLLAAAWTIRAQTTVFDPHADPMNGVLIETSNPSTRGQCTQCHPTHGEDFGPAPSPPVLFTENSNAVAFWAQGDGPCHRDRPDNYPLIESDRIPETEPDAGYFEANSAGTRRVGLQYRGRWPGETIYTDSRMTASGHYYSPHAQDPDMPRRSAGGEGLCLNCHDPHGTENRRDILIATYGGIGGADAVGPPVEYALCFSCHSQGGSPGMDVENRYIADYYDSGLNGDTAGHQIRRDPDIAISWPPHIQVGDMLPCYDCHNPHGSEGGDGVQPNAFLLSDERPEWSGLTDTRNDPIQCRTFCFGCHIPADGIPGTKEVEGIVMNTIPSRSAHLSTSTRSCYDCHRSDYSDPQANNVHNPRS